MEGSIQTVAPEAVMTGKMSVSASAEGGKPGQSFDSMLNEIASNTGERDPADSEPIVETDNAKDESVVILVAPIDWCILNIPGVENNSGGGNSGQEIGYNSATDVAGSVTEIGGVSAGAVDSSVVISAKGSAVVVSSLSTLEGEDNAGAVSNTEADPAISKNVQASNYSSPGESVTVALNRLVGEGQNADEMPTKLVTIRKNETISEADPAISKNVQASNYSSPGESVTVALNRLVGEGQNADDMPAKLVIIQKNETIGPDLRTTAGSDIDELPDGSDARSTGQSTVKGSVAFQRVSSGSVSSDTGLFNAKFSEILNGIETPGSEQSVDDNQSMPEVNTVGRGPATIDVTGKTIQENKLADSVVQQIESRVQFLSYPRRREIKIEFEPESLGRVSVSIVQEKGGIMTVRMMADNPLAKDLIESRIQELKAAFERQGLKVDGFSVGLGQGNAYSGGDAGFAFSQGDPFSKGTRLLAGSQSLPEGDEPANPMVSSGAGVAIDLRV